MMIYKYVRICMLTDRNDSINSQLNLLSVALNSLLSMDMQDFYDHISMKINDTMCAHTS